MAVGRSSSGSERTYRANSLAWAYLGAQDQGSVALQSASEALPLHRLRVEGPLEGQLDSSCNRSRQEIGSMRIGYGVPVGSDPVEPEAYTADSIRVFQTTSNELTVSYDVNLLDHGQPEDILRCRLPTNERGMSKRNDRQASTSSRGAQTAFTETSDPGVHFL